MRAITRGNLCTEWVSQKQLLKPLHCVPTRTMPRVDPTIARVPCGKGGRAKLRTRRRACSAVDDAPIAVGQRMEWIHCRCRRGRRGHCRAPGHGARAAGPHGDDLRSAPSTATVVAPLGARAPERPLRSCVLPYACAVVVTERRHRVRMHPCRRARCRHSQAAGAGCSLHFSDNAGALAAPTTPPAASAS